MVASIATRRTQAAIKRIATRRTQAAIKHVVEASIKRIATQRTQAAIKRIATRRMQAGIKHVIVIDDTSVAYKAHLALLPQADIIPTADPTGDVASASSTGIIPIPDIRTPSTDINTVPRIPTNTTASITAHTTKE
jgi:hypothetical protein